MSRVPVECSGRSLAVSSSRDPKGTLTLDFGTRLPDRRGPVVVSGPGTGGVEGCRLVEARRGGVGASRRGGWEERRATTPYPPGSSPPGRVTRPSLRPGVG